MLSRADGIFVVGFSFMKLNANDFVCTYLNAKAT